VKIVYILSDSPVKPCGGLGERIIKMAPILEKAGIEIYVYCAGEGGVIKGTNIQCKAIDVECPAYGNPYPMMYANFIMDNPPPFTPDIVIATDHGTVPAAKTLASIYGAKLVTEFHLAYYSLKKILKQEELQGPLKLDQAARLVELTEKIAVDSSDLIIGCSNQYIKDLPWKAKKAVAIQNGIDAHKYEGEHPKFKFEGGFKRNIVFIGRMNTQKGLRYLMDYYGFVDNNGRHLIALPREYRLELPEDTALHFVGGPVGGDQFDALLETVKSNPQKFHIPFIHGDEKIALLKSADAIVFPSIHEPFGIVGLEAFAANVPLITTGVDGIADYANEDNCIMVKADAKSIRKGIDRCFAMSQEERTKMLEEAKKTAFDFNWEKAAELTINELTLLLDKKKAALG
jgi:glycosyltransferase involved in cell wall biosynthesis